MSRTSKVIMVAAAALMLSACVSAPRGPGSNPCAAQNAAIGGVGLGAIGSGIGLAAGGATGGIAGGLIGLGAGALGGSQVGC